MKNKIKFLSLILFISALLVFIPSISHAYDSDEEVPINYTIKINKIDSADNKNLRGARFTLKDKDGNVVATQTTDDNGILSFGNIKTYGTGTDIYYIEEVKTPRGYILDEKETIEVTVQKTVTNVATGGYKLKITCQTLDYDTDITRYDFVPVYDVDDLKAVGSGAIRIHEGKPYRYTTNTNYRLMNDIDLSNEQWEPIDVPVSGIFDGYGHSIKNLTITPDGYIDYKEVGLFKHYTGIVQDLKLEDVNIVIPGYVEEPTSISGKGGVGAFTGFMGSGTFKNCEVSGNITANVDNIGGLAGHTDENVIIKLQNCKNKATIIGYDANPGSWDIKRFNVGGLIGCAMCSLSVDNCTNEGTLNGNASNVGGLIGHAESKGYEERAIKAGYAEDGNTITLLIGNSRSESEYDLYLEDKDLRSLNILPGGIFTVYDSTLEPIEGFENVKLEDGKLLIGSVNIKFEGRDTYFVRDVTPVEGYRRIAGYIKVVVTRYWDFEAERFRVTVDSKVIDENKIQDEIGNNTDIDLDSITDTFAPEISFDNVGWNTAKVTFVDCKNTGAINGYRNIAGLAGTVYHAKTSFVNCLNEGAVSANGYGKAGGMISELYVWGDGTFCDITDCTNKGRIASNCNNNASSGGMAAQVISNIRITNCVNKGEIWATGPSGAGGIVSDVTGTIYIDNCKNKATVETNYNGVDAEAGGIVAKNMTRVYADPIHISANLPQTSNNIYLTNCENTGDVKAGAHLGGILGYSEANYIKVDNCKTYGESEDNKVIIEDKYAADKAAIIGYANTPYIDIANCSVNNVEVKRTSSNVGNTYGCTAGILGNWCGYGNISSNLTSLTISNCTVNNSYFYTRGQSTAGILAAVIGGNNQNISIKDCNVNNCQMHNDNNGGSYDNVSGIFAMTYYANTVVIDNCDVTDSTITNGSVNSYSGGDSNAGGIMAFCFYPKTVLNIKDCDVTNTKIKNYCIPRGGCPTTAGILAHARGYNSSSSILAIDNCSYTGANKENKTDEDADIYTVDEDISGVIATIHDFKDVIVSNTEVKDCYIVSNSVDSTSSTMSGMATYVTGRDLHMSNNTVDNLTLHLNTPTPAGGTGISGFLSIGATNNTYIINCDISNSTFISPGAYSSSYGGGYSCMAGIMAYGYSDTVISECDVNNCNLTGTAVGTGAQSVANIGGIVGCAGSSYVVNKCTVKNSNLTSVSTTASNGTNCTVGGLVSDATSNLTLNESLVENCNISGGAMCTGGAVGNVCGTFTPTNVTVKDVNITDRGTFQYGTYSNSTALRSVGGIIGYASTTKATNINAINVSIDSQALAVGGLVGTSSGGFIKNSTVSNLTAVNAPTDYRATTYGTLGGLCGQFNGGTISSCTVTTANLTSDFDSVGGAIGCANGTMTISGVTIIGLTGKNNNVNGISSVGHSGGLIGISTGANLTITGTQVKNSSITVEDTLSNSKHLGGMIGLSGDVVFTDCDVIGTTVNDKTYGSTGGFVGQTGMEQTRRYRATMEDCSVSGDTTISTLGHAGGLIGCGLTTINSPIISGVTIKSNGTMCAGGIAGITDNSSSISDVTISDINVTAGQHVGGIVAVMYGSINAGTVSNAKLTSIGSGTNEVGGVAGVLNGSLTGVTITGATISSIAGDVGGAVGATTGTITGVSVYKTSLTSSKVIGGIVGAGYEDAPTLTDVLVDEETQASIEANTTAEYKHQILGVPQVPPAPEPDPDDSQNNDDTDTDNTQGNDPNNSLNTNSLNTNSVNNNVLNNSLSNNNSVDTISGNTSSGDSSEEIDKDATDNTESNTTDDQTDKDTDNNVTDDQPADNLNEDLNNVSENTDQNSSNDSNTDETNNTEENNG